MKRAILVAALSLAWAANRFAPADQPSNDTPRSPDPRLRVERFAAAPDIVHPIGIDFDSRGRLLVIESHTHFRPQGYKGPPHDRVLALEDTDGDGKADRFTVFFEGTRATMDLAVHPDGSVYLATRNEVLRLRDTDGDGKADERRRVVFLDTKGDYPHNGLSGLCFDSKGDLYFGMGENLGAAYRLVGSDGVTIGGEGDGGHVFHSTADGRQLRRVATGFWNPFGVCRDVFGRLFAVDNDPDASPPCRLVHLVEGGDYGYQFRYGRSGRHPFQAWDGQLLGTLPMASGTGEAPCEVLAYESDGLPPEYRGQLLVAAWADHRVERYELKERGASVVAERRPPLLVGGADFRPVGVAVAPDGSLFVSDWVLRDYNLHGKGAIWHVRRTDAARPDRPDDPRRALASAHRPLRDAAARKLAGDELGRQLLRSRLTDTDPRFRAACLTALLDAGDRATDPTAVAEKDPLTAVRAMAVRGLVARGADARRFLDARHPAAVRLEAVGCLGTKDDLPRLLPLLADADPFLRRAAIRQLGRAPALLTAIDAHNLSPAQRAGLLLAWRAAAPADAGRRAREFLADPDEDVRFLAAKWAADEKLEACRPPLAAALAGRDLNPRLALAFATALARLDGREVNEAALADHFLARVTDAAAPAADRARALRLVPAAHKALTVELLGGLLRSGDAALQLEAIRALAEHPAAGRFALLRQVATGAAYPEAVRAEAVAALAEKAEVYAADLLALARSDSPALRDEALRALAGTRRAEVEPLPRGRGPTADLTARVLGRPFAAGRPPAAALDAWLARLDGPADPAAGRRVFFHPKLAGCSRCHRVDGRGSDVGPDLSTIGQRDRRHVLESILQPGAQVAPHYQNWQVETADGKVRTGLLVRTYLDETTYLDPKGERFTVKTGDVTETRPLPTSVMPDGLAELLTDQELRDLLAYLCSRR